MSPNLADYLRLLADLRGGYRGVPIHFDENLGRSIVSGMSAPRLAVWDFP